MTSEMNVLIERLQQAIDEAISNSGRINAIVDEMKRSGFDVCLIVESSAAISPVEDATPSKPVPGPAPDFDGEMQLTTEDLAFLQEMNIAA
jgi:hypothetical protein